ncbi:MAG: hypothetical protein ACRC06_16215 [Waterburya sp.]
MLTIPNYITHYYQEENILFQNICNYSNAEAELILENLRKSGQRAWLHLGYLEERRIIETWLYNELIKKG